MKIALNSERVNFVFIGGLYWSFSDEKPIEVDLSTLSRTALSQVAMHVKAGVLIAEDTEKLLSMVNMSQEKALSEKTQKSQVASKDLKDVLRERESEQSSKIAEVMKQSHARIRRDILTFSLRELRAMELYEETNRKRKTVLSLLKKIINKHVQDVSKAVNSKVSQNDTVSDTTLKASKYRDNVSDVVQLDSEKIEIECLKSA